MKIDECINYLLTQAQNKVNNRFKENLSEYGITPAQYMILYHLWEEDGLSPKKLAAFCNLDASTITGLLTRMEKKNLIKRKHCENDRRTVNVYLTQQGKNLEEVILKIIEKSNSEILEPLSQDERVVLKEFLNRISS